MMDLSGKKLLILGGAYQHRKIVRKAGELGIETYVTDYLPEEDSPARQLADHSLQINVTDVDALIDLCRKEKIDGVICPYLDIVQLPYQQICEAMAYPCFGTREQHRILTDKNAFKEFCENHGADVIPSFTEEQIEADEAPYPILIKPADSRGSRGLTVCTAKEESRAAIGLAKQESRNGKIVIEKYMEGMADLQLQYLVVNGEPLLYKVEDRYLGSQENGLDKLCITSVSPSKVESAFRTNADPTVVKCIKDMGLRNAPVFIQAFFDGKRAYLYDPGLRFPGDDYDDGHKYYTGIDIPEIMVRFALTGEISDTVAEQLRSSRMQGYCALVMPCLKAGTIAEICGLDAVAEHPNVVSFSTAYRIGDAVSVQKNVRQRFGEFVVVADDREKLGSVIRQLYEKLHIYDENGNEMLIERFDTELLADYGF